MKLDYGFELIENDSILKELNIDKSPAMMINGKVVVEGRVPSLKEVKKILYEELLKNNN